IDHQAAWAPVASADELGHVAGDVLAPVPRAARSPVTIVAAVEDPDDTAAAVAVVVVVAGEDVAEGVQAGLVVVALAVCEDLELLAVAVGAEGGGEVGRDDGAAGGVDDVGSFGGLRRGRLGR